MHKAVEELLWRRLRHGSWFEENQTKSLNEWQLRDPPLELTAPVLPHQVYPQFWDSLSCHSLSFCSTMAALPCYQLWLSVLSFWLYLLSAASPTSLPFLNFWWHFSHEIPIAEVYELGFTTPFPENFRCESQQWLKVQHIWDVAQHLIQWLTKFY